jgi:hypothetical protein
MPHVALMREHVYVARMSTTQAPAAVRLREDAYAEWMTRLGLFHEVTQAEHLGVSRATIGRARRGEITPGNSFIAACMAKYDGKFEDLFEVAS